MPMKEDALALHRKKKGKLAVKSKVPLKTMQDLSLAYTPGVAEVSNEIARNKKAVYDYTMKRNAVAVVTDGSAVLGLGNIGPEAALPVMEGKEGEYRDNKNNKEHRSWIRRNKPRGYNGAKMLRDRGCFAGPRHPGLPRRPARDCHRYTRSSHKCRKGCGKEDRRAEGSNQRSRGGGHICREAAHVL